MKVSQLWIATLLLAVVHADDEPANSNLRVLGGTCGCANRGECQCCVSLDTALPAFIAGSLCGNWYVLPTSLSIGVMITWTNRTLFSTGISPDSAPPICVPLIPPIILSACVKVNNVTQHLFYNDNSGGDSLLGACINATLQAVGFNLLNIRLGCARLTRNGLQLTRVVTELNSTLPSTTARTNVWPLSFFGGK